MADNESQSPQQYVPPAPNKGVAPAPQQPAPAPSGSSSNRSQQSKGGQPSNPVRSALQQALREENQNLLARRAAANNVLYGFVQEDNTLLKYSQRTNTLEAADSLQWRPFNTEAVLNLRTGDLLATFDPDPDSDKMEYREVIHRVVQMLTPNTTRIVFLLGSPRNFMVPSKETLNKVESEPNT